MKLFKRPRLWPILLAAIVVSAGYDVLAQGKGKGGQRGGGHSVQQGNRGGGHPQVRREQLPRIPHQVRQPQVQPNPGIDRRAQMQQRVQQVPQRRVQQNPAVDRRAQMQQRMHQVQQQRMQQNPVVDRRAQMQQRMHQIQQQRIQQVQRVPANDRRAVMWQRMQQSRQQRIQQTPAVDRRALMQQRMQQIRQQRVQRVQQPVPANDRRAVIWQRMQQNRQQVEQNRAGDRMARREMREVERRQRGSAWAGQRTWSDRSRNIGQPQIVPQQKLRDWYPQIGQTSRNYERGLDGNFAHQRRFRFLSEVWPQSFGPQQRGEARHRGAERRAWRERTAWSYSTPVFSWQQPTYTRTYRPRTFFDSYLFANRPRAAEMYRGWDGYYSGNWNNYYRGNYGQPYYDYEYDRASVGEIFRSVIFAVLSGGASSVVDDQYYYDSGYVEDHYWSTPPSYTLYDSGAYYPAGYSYATDPFYYDPYFYEDPYYAEVLPIQYFVGDQPGGGLFRQLFTHLLAIGYEQGYQDGVAAREIAEVDRVLYDPYAYDNVSYDPYSVSLGDNRRCLSQGYELGYQDAVNEIAGYDRFQDGGVDLVSVLIGSVSQIM